MFRRRRNGVGPAGSYNIAADGVVTVADVVSAFGGHAVRIPHVAATAASALLAHLPFTTSQTLAALANSRKDPGAQ